MISFAMPAVCAAVNFSNPGTGTPCNFPTSSIWGGRPGEKSKSLTLLETPSMRCRTTMKFGGAALEDCGSVVDVGFCIVLISEWCDERRVTSLALMQTALKRITRHSTGLLSLLTRKQ